MTRPIKIIFFFLGLMIIIALGVFGYRWYHSRATPGGVLDNSPTALSNSAARETSTQLNQRVQAAAANDTDLDGLSNTEEKKLGTDPNLADTDGDGLLDGAEVYIYHTDPLKKNTLPKKP